MSRLYVNLIKSFVYRFIYLGKEKVWNIIWIKFCKLIIVVKNGLFLCKILMLIFDFYDFYE